MDNIYYAITENGELVHSGKKGMRWGRRLYQNEDGSLTPLGRIHYGIGQARTRAKRKAALKKARETRAANKKAAAEAKAKEAEEEAKRKADEEALAKKKADILQRADAKEVYENRQLFSYQELNVAKMRIEMERSIKNLEPEPVNKGKEFADKFIKGADTISNMVNSGSKMYNSFAKIYNSIYGNKKDAALPMVDDKIVTAMDKYKQETEWIKAKNDRKNALDAAKDKVKSELELYKEETEWKKAMNERKKAEDEAAPKAKSELEKLRERNAMAEAENRRREIERTSREHDRKDQREQEAIENERKEAKAAEKRAKAERKAAKQKAKAEADEQARLANEERSRAEYESTHATTSEYNKSGTGKEYVNPNQSRGLAIYNPSGSGLSSTASRGKSYVNDSANTNNIDVGDISKIRTMTSNSNKTYDQIAESLGVSVSTVQKYSSGRDYVQSHSDDQYMTYDEDDRFTGYWSAIKDDSDGII